jgi:exopolysaccharide biosynthesis polyprenyl glycosylphosphotransferase
MAGVAAATERAADLMMTVPRVLPRGLQPSEHRALLAAGDAIAATAAVVAALWLWSIPAGWRFSVELVTGHAWWFAAAAAWLLAASFPAAPSSIAFSLRRTLATLARGAAILLIAYGAWYFYAPRGVLPRLVVLYFLWEAILLTLAWRLIFVTAFSQGFRQRVVIVGSGRAAALALSTLRLHRSRQVDVVGFVPESGQSDLSAEASAKADAALDVPPIDAARLLEGAAERGASELILALHQPPSEALLTSLRLCQEAGAQVVRVQTLIEQVRHRVPVDLLQPDWLMTDLADAVRLSEASWVAKRLFDLAGATIGLAAFAVATPFIAIAILLDSGAPIFYRQERVGRGGALFTVVKFRTMAKDAERPGEARWADRDDPRTTRVGRWLRRTRLDELPQFANILRGEMSLVGPRPERLEFIADLQEAIPFYRARLMVPPGLTGWAQVNLPYGDSVEAARAKLEYDLYYVKHRSVTFDLAIVLRTFGIVLRMGGH